MNTWQAWLDNAEKANGWQVVKAWKDEVASYVILKYTSPHVTRFSSWHCGYCLLPSAVGDGSYDSLQIEVNGGLTFAESFVDGHAYGFDCAHLGDDRNPNLQDIEWLTQHCESMARQIEALREKKEV